MSVPAHFVKERKVDAQPVIDAVSTQLASLEKTVEPATAISHSVGEVAVRFADVAMVVTSTIG